MGLLIEPVGPAHAALLAALHAACFAAPDDERWDAAAFAGLLGPAGGFALVAFENAAFENGAQDGADPAGLAVARVLFEDAELLTIGTVPAARRRGIGAALLDAVEAAVRAAGATRLLLEVAEDNGAAQALYAAHGYTTAGRRPGYYRSGRVAALVLAKDLRP
ncbi:MAG TPA: GNAT family N-acetyltransferase [Alphaproteobacteria bacterium]|nr:GNAT family N-acetyltransferase [Alphaproteobacteria bacterium]